jgi:hypothetical protein
VESVAGPSIEPVPPVSSVPDTSPTVAASAKDAPVRTAPVVAAAPPAPAAAAAPTPPIGIPAAHHTGSGVTTPSQATTPSSAAPPTRGPATEPITAVTGGHQRPGQQETSVRPGLGQSPLAPGQQVSSGIVGGGSGGAPGSEKSAGAWGKPGGGTAEGTPRVPSSSGEEALLGKGKVSGSVPGGTSGSTNVGPGFANVRAAGGVGALAEGAPAIGAAGVGGATSGERERNRPGRGDASKRVRQLPVGDLPEEEEALLAQKAAPEPPSREHTRAILEPAATQDGDEDAEHVRRFGVDDRDLFADPREVSVDLIGGKSLPEE